MAENYASLNPTKALIWRIVHRNNLPWILENGLHCGNSPVQAPDWISLGNPELIIKRNNRLVPTPPHGVLNDYIPFYFTPFSVMLKNINTGWGGIQKYNSSDIIILVSSLPHLQQQNIPFLFTDSHAYHQYANFYEDLTDLDKIDWPLLQRRDFKRDPDDPRKFERYQAEALIHRHCPISGLLGIICYTDELQAQIEQLINQYKTPLKVHQRRNWYFQ
jgi:ssDNA thymidine ADP-ribosyltransferase, DarT